MNLKQLVPSYRARFRFVERTLDQYSRGTRLEHILNLGCGIGEFDPMIKHFCDRLDSCDLNPEDVRSARLSMEGVDGLHYATEDALVLGYGKDQFDAVVCTDTLEHTADPARAIAEIARVLKRNGIAILTCPNLDFPFPYDPLNFILGYFSRRISFGAYAYGHTFLISDSQMVEWLFRNGLEISSRENFVHALSGMTEAYWPGIAQKCFRPSLSTKEPGLARLTDLLNRWDSRLFKTSRRSVSLGYVVRKAGR